MRIQKRTPHNIEVYNVIMHLINKLEYHEMMWENCDTDLCAIVQLLSNNTDSDISRPPEVVASWLHKYSCCSLYCPCWTGEACALRRFLV